MMVRLHGCRSRAGAVVAVCTTSVLLKLHTTASAADSVGHQLGSIGTSWFRAPFWVGSGCVGMQFGGQTIYTRFSSSTFHTISLVKVLGMLGGSICALGFGFRTHHPASPPLGQLPPWSSQSYWIPEESKWLRLEKEGPGVKPGWKV